MCVIVSDENTKACLRQIRLKKKENEETHVIVKQVKIYFFLLTKKKQTNKERTNERKI